jgi:hypothetical protein
MYAQTVTSWEIKQCVCAVCSCTVASNCYPWCTQRGSVNSVPGFGKRATRTRVFPNEVFIWKLGAVRRDAPRAVAFQEIPTLDHEVLYDAVERGVFVPHRGEVTLVFMFARAELAEVLGGFRADVRPELHRDPAHRGAADCDVEEHHRVLGVRLSLVPRIGGHFLLGQTRRAKGFSGFGGRARARRFCGELSRRPEEVFLLKLNCVSNPKTTWRGGDVSL